MGTFSERAPPARGGTRQPFVRGPSRKKTQKIWPRLNLQGLGKETRRSENDVCARWTESRPGCGGLTTLALIRGDTGPPNLLSAQFLGTMEFRAHRYAILLTALCLAA